MINLKKRTTTPPTRHDDYPTGFQEAFFSALSDVVSADELDKSITSIISATRRAFSGSAALFRRSGDSAALVQFSAEKPDEIPALLVKAGIRLSAGKIPLTSGRAKIFELPYTEYDDLFQLIGDMTSSAACRKIQRDLNFSW
ncbi:MAG TPA: hypothetical protein PL001_10700, partial [Candidatus Kryptobacter bacterium]|nr:hypothetical protein [Candidatus Kryptobacter bacterium]